MTRTTKREIMNQFETLFDTLKGYHDNELEQLRQQGKITYGSYWYVLNPFETYGAKEMYGLNGKKPMILNKQNHTVWHFNYMLNDLKKLEQEILQVLEENK